ncbi:uncharacterized protein SAPINGB_P005165 [Magnusiomyces paraingens]|uniref:FAD/NAD(P)-binding domain-containing protein n=1 Tax=Magnusiomyces paraingens TaxID=2606893 RepID=A0A5E8C457_9ASCO|nr:uncharacterized protein SAPINGB_P005165 [Saprochaete ingens]VVT56588.1 unnamed protein product [Saprochaete ingens]
MPLYDCLIIGGGPAGLSTALGLCRAVRSCVVFDDGRYRNWATSYMHTVPTWDHRRPEDYRQAATEELLNGRYDTVSEISTSPVLDVVVRVVVDSNDSNGHSSPRRVFVAIDQNGTEWHARTVVFASGVEDLLPPNDRVPGFASGWGQCIFHCLFCHGFEERGAESAGVLILTPGAFQFSAAFAGMAARLARKITVYTNGLDLSEGGSGPDPIEGLLRRNEFDIDTRPIERLTPYKTNADRRHEDGPPGIDIHFKDGSIPVHHAFLVCRPEQRVRNRRIMEALGVRFAAATGLAEVVSPMNATHVPGVFVAGDNNTMYQQVVNAFCQGGMVSGGVHHYLLTKELNGE